jgi:hypothetical protein
MRVSKSHEKVSIRVYGFLRQYMDKEKLPYVLDWDIPTAGCPANAVARELSLPLDRIEAVFCNGRIINIYDRIRPGDRVAFFPHGTPGPYRVFLGMARENKARALREKQAQEAVRESE